MVHSRRVEFLIDVFAVWFAESIGSGQESDVEDNINPDLLIEPSVKGYDPTIDERLPETVSILTTKAGSKLYLVGTAHFSLASQEDVAKVAFKSNFQIFSISKRYRLVFLKIMNIDLKNIVSGHSSGSTT